MRPTNPQPTARMNARLLCASSVVLLCSLLLGCGRTDYEVAPVSGRLLLDGKPAAGYSVTFQPVAASPDETVVGPGSYGKTDAEGRYTLRVTTTDRPGAVVGRHRVSLSPPGTSVPAEESEDGVEMEDPSADWGPRHFYDGSIQFDVPEAGTDQADLDVPSR